MPVLLWVSLYLYIICVCIVNQAFFNTYWSSAIIMAVFSFQPRGFNNNWSIQQVWTEYPTVWTRGRQPCASKGVLGLALSENLEFQSLRIGFPAFWVLNWVQKSDFHSRKCSFQLRFRFISHTNYKQWTNVHLNKNKFCVHLLRNVWRSNWNTAFAELRHTCNSKPVGLYVSLYVFCLRHCKH